MSFIESLKHRYTQLVVENAKLRRRIRELELHQKKIVDVGVPAWVLVKRPNGPLSVETGVIGRAVITKTLGGENETWYYFYGLSSFGAVLKGEFSPSDFGKRVFLSEEAAKKHLPKKGETENARK